MIVAFSAQQATAWTNGELRNGALETSLAAVSIDSRSVGPKELFVAIAGPHHDGHRFLSDALARGAGGIMVERGRPLPDDISAEIVVIAVDDTTHRLGSLAAGHRADFHGPLVAITGSNGKTTTKEMCAAILSVGAPCHRTPGNFNNQYGLPLTLLGRNEDDRSLVVEVGMNHRGEIRALAALARPTVGLISNVGTAHIEHLGSREEIALEKGDLVAGLPADATAVLNADDPLVTEQAARSRAQIVRFGIQGEADVRAERIEQTSGQTCSFELVTPNGCISLEVRGMGPTTISNALGAAAAALAAGASLTDVKTGLANYQPMKGRLERRDLAGNVVLVDDTYNANPQSTEAALRLLAQLKGEHRAMAVLGDMGELGEAAKPAHHASGRLAADLKIDFLIALGEKAEWIASGALESGMDRERVMVARDHADASARANEILRDHDTVLVKGSRSMQMERVVESIVTERGV